MVCEDNETDLQIGIPVVMLPQNAGANLENYLQNSTGMPIFFMYSSNLIWQLVIPSRALEVLSFEYLPCLVVPDLAFWFLWYALLYARLSFFSVCAAILSTASTGWHCRGVFMAYGCWYHLMCLVLVCMEC